MKKLNWKCFSPVALLLLLTLGCASAPKAPVVVEKPGERPSWAIPYFMTALPYSADQLVPPPPADGSETDLADMKVLLEWQKKRTGAQCVTAGKQSIPTLLGSYDRSSIGDKGLPDFSKLNPEALTALKNLFEHTQRDVGFFSHEGKVLYARKRPYDRNAELSPCIKRESSLSYPSGHAAFGEAGALLLTEIFPRNARALAKAGAQLGLNRIIGGVHHPSDVAVGAKYGRAAYTIISQNLRFQAELAEVKRLIGASTNAKARKAFSPGKVLEKAASAAAAHQ